MIFNLFNRLISWLRRIFHIHLKIGYRRETVETTLQSKEESTRNSGDAKAKGEVVQKEERDTLKLRKPYKKKVPTEEKKRELIKLSRTKVKVPSLKQRKAIYLSPTQRRRRGLIGVQQESVNKENIEAKMINRESKEKEFSTMVESPFIEINLDNIEVCLILPKQQFEVHHVAKTLHQVSYILNLNDKQQKIPVGVTINGSGLMFVEEKRILLEEPLAKFKVAFPDEIHGREYSYNHIDKGLYVFVAAGNNRGRMFYLYGEDGNINFLCKRVVWVLIHEEFMLQTIRGPGDIADERWIWNKYKPFRIDLSEANTLVIKNKISSREKKFDLQSTFHIEGEQLIEDDFKKECPLFTGKTLKMIAPYENQSGWNVWIQNKEMGYKIKKNWIGREPLTLGFPDELPCEFGEFQVDICQQNTRVPDDTLFFRLLPILELNYPKELIIPDPKSGDFSSTISIRLNSNDVWKLEHKEDIKSELTKDNFYKAELPPEESVFRFSMVNTAKPESICNFQITLPRLKWKTSKQKVWGSKTLKIGRNDLKSGESFSLKIQTNDFNNKYNLLAILQTNDQKLQEERLIQKGVEYSLELNQFYDTIKQNKDKLNLKVRIQNEEYDHLVGEVYILEFTSPIIYCKSISCDYKTHCREEMLSHFEKCHLCDLVEHLSYEEIREYDESLPHKIYNCAYCSFYICENDPRNPTSVICWHIENKCPKVDREKGLPKISFRVVDNIDEIRQNVFPSLSHIYKCKLCGIHFKDYDNKTKVEHFFSKHENRICEYS